MNEVRQVDTGRRKFLEATGGMTLLGLLVAAGILKPGAARAADWNKAAFDARSMKDALDALGAGTPAQATDVVITAPDIAENGSVVPLSATSNLPKTESIAFLVDKNPNMLAASFLLSEGSVPVVSTRVKLAETSNVSVLVKADGKFYVATKEIKVTLGGCGG
ncbi:MAG TPA: thiosulfate oxidation carrier protein SoxY [Anaeromyxobacteraceae bacterium]|nr:thiosulfate oxidation carrier protein SoxY [Anaeromyxobacteraceae bacterium]